MSGITTHVLDTARGRPAAGMRLVLEAEDGDGWTGVGGGVTDADEILAALTERLGNDPATELRVAAEEHRRITRLRIERLMAP